MSKSVTKADTPSPQWLSAAEFAEAVGIKSDRHARRVLSAAAAGKPWKGQNLRVRKVQGQPGGASGEAYQVERASLPILRGGGAKFFSEYRIGPPALPVNSSPAGRGQRVDSPA